MRSLAYTAKQNYRKFYVCKGAASLFRFAAPFSLDILLGKFQPVHGSYDFGAVFPSLQPIGVLV